MSETCTPLDCCVDSGLLEYRVAGSDQFTVTTSVSPAGISSTAGGGIYDPGDSVTVIATAELGYEFMGWYNAGGERVATVFNYTFTIYNSQALEARFVPE